MLYIVATPIGNLDEITYRAVEVLKSVDYIAAEDTRHTRILLERYAIATPMRVYQKFNERAASVKIIDDLKEGKNIALVSDAGMPLISDPGAVLVEELIANNLEYTVISGANAALNALVLSGLPCRAFLVAGFLPDKKGEKVEYINRFKDVRATLIFYSAVHDIIDDIATLASVLGDRKVAVVREISKIYETVARGTLQNPPQIVEKGEFVIVVEGADVEYADLLALTPKQHLDYYLNSGMEKSAAIKRVAKERNVAKNVIYALAVNDKKQDG